MSEWIKMWKKDPETSQAKTLFSCIWAQYDVNYVQYWKNFSSLLSSILPPYFRNRSSLIRILVYILQLVSSTMSNFWKTFLVYLMICKGWLPYLCTISWWFSEVGPLLEYLVDFSITLHWSNPMTWKVLDCKIQKEIEQSNKTPKAEFWIVKARVRSLGFVIQDFLSHGISIPK